MKRFHVHLSVADLESSTTFYTGLFGQEPTARHADYAKWMIEDPRVNFAISSRGRKPGLDHFGFQAESTQELLELQGRAEQASPGEVLQQPEARCCHASGDKHWTRDPQGISWEHFQTIGEIPDFGSDTTSDSSACCTPAVATTTCCTPGAATSACC